MGEPSPPPKRRPLRWLVRLAALLILLVGLLVAFVPTILSTDGFRNTLVDRANGSLAGTVEIDTLRFSWTEGQRIQGLSVWPGRAGEGQPLLRLPQAEFAMSFAPLLSGNLDVQAAVEGFAAQLVLHADGRTSLDDLLGTSPEDPAADESDDEHSDSERTDGPATIAPLPLRADIALRGGSALVVDEKLGITTGVEGLAVDVTSADYDDPVELLVTGDTVLADERFPFELRASGLGADEPGWSFSFRADGLSPGSATQPLLAAVFPLLAGADEDEPVRIDAPLDIDIELNGSSLQELAAGALSGVSGRVSITLGDGRVQGGLLGSIQSALTSLTQGGAGLADTGLGPLDLGALGDLSAALEERDLELDFHGLVGALSIGGGRIEIDQLALTGSDGENRPLPIEGHVQLAGTLTDSTLHYRIPWAGLLRSERVSEYFGDAALAIEGPLGAPRFDLGLDLRGAAEDAVQRRLDGELDKLQDKLGEKLGQDIDLRGITDPGKAGETLGEILEQQAAAELGGELDLSQPDKAAQSLFDGLLKKAAEKEEQEAAEKAAKAAKKAAKKAAAESTENTPAAAAEADGDDDGKQGDKKKGKQGGKKKKGKQDADDGAGDAGDSPDTPSGGHA